MILLVVIPSGLITAVAILQYREQRKDYHRERLARKEEQIKQSVNYTLQNTTYPISPENLGLIFKEDIYQIADVQNQNFNIYDLSGELIKSSRPKFVVDSIAMCLDVEVLDRLIESIDKRYLEENSAAGDDYQSSYT